MTRSDCSIYAAAGSDVSRRTLYVPSVLHLVQASLDEYHACRLYGSWCRLRLTIANRAVYITAGAGSDLRAKCIFYVS